MNRNARLNSGIISPKLSPHLNVIFLSIYILPDSLSLAIFKNSFNSLRLWIFIGDIVPRVFNTY